MRPSLSLRLGLAVLAAPALSSAGAPITVASPLAARCRAWAADSNNPWALAHGMALDGRAFTARDGRPAAEVVVTDYLRQSPTSGRVAGASRPGDLFFVAFALDGTPVEPHPALHLKTLLLAGYRMEDRFQLPWGTLTVRQLVMDLKGDFSAPRASSPEGAWTLDALSQVMKPGETFRDGTGARVRIDTVMETALATLEADHAEVAAGMKARKAQVPKRRQGIYAHPCGGLHFFQAVAGWARHPSVREAWKKRLDAQVEVLLYRLDSEARQYESALAAAPEHRLPLLVQMLKFYGHLLETLGRYRDDTGWRPTPAQRETVDRARTYLERTAVRLDEAGAFRGPKAPEVLVHDRQLALDLIGDTCHAARGEALWNPGPAAR